MCIRDSLCRPMSRRASRDFAGSRTSGGLAATSVSLFFEGEAWQQDCETCGRLIRTTYRSEDWRSMHLCLRLCSFGQPQPRRAPILSPTTIISKNPATLRSSIFRRLGRSAAETTFTPFGRSSSTARRRGGRPSYISTGRRRSTTAPCSLALSLIHISVLANQRHCVGDGRDGDHLQK